MPSWEKIKNALEWVHLTRVAGEILLAIASAGTFRTVLLRITSLSKDSASIIAAFVGGSILLGIAWWRRRTNASRQKQTLQNATNTLVTSPTIFNVNMFLSQAYSSTLQQETENNVRAMVNQTQPTDREAFYVKFIATGIIGYIYDIAWAYIYRSQVLLLLELNRRIMPLAEVKTFYEKAASDNKSAYADYSFSQWLEFMKFYILIIQHESEMVEITLRGKDFLKYLVHWGRYADDRRL